jgi:hypothetical protein
VNAATQAIDSGAVRVTDAERLTRAGRIFITVVLIVVLEGAIRKWLSSSLTLPLVLTRDALASYAIVYAFMHGHLHRYGIVSRILLAWSCCVVIWGMLQLILGESNTLVLFIGLRFWLLYVWFAFAITAAMSEHDFRVAIKTLLWVLVLTGPLVVLQSFSPTGARINTEVDSDSEAFTVGRGIVRTTGTFSFTAGQAAFVALCTPLAVLMFESRKRNVFQRLFSVAVLGAFLAAVVVSGSRGAILFSGGLFGLYLLGSVFLAPGKRKVVALFATVFIVIMLGLSLYVFRDAVEATQERFEIAAEAGDVIGDRLVSAFVGEPNIFEKFTWTGYGLGLGSNLAGYVQSPGEGERVFLLSETETGRTLLEAGLLGYVLIALKTALGVVGLAKSTLQALRTRRMFAMLLWIALFFALFTWSYIGQLTINAIFGVMLALGLLAFKFPNFQLLK